VSTIGPSQCAVQQRETAGHDERRACSLDHSSADENLGSWRSSARHRGNQHHGQTDHQDTPSTKPVGQRSGQQEESGNADQVSGHHPLQTCDAGVQATTDRRDSQGDDIGV
jgi:hypothetical protein